MPNRGFHGGRFRGGRGRGTHNSRGRGREQGIIYMDDFDVPIQLWPNDGMTSNTGLPNVLNLLQRRRTEPQLPRTWVALTTELENDRTQRSWHT